MEKKESSNEIGGAGLPLSSKSRSKRMPRTHHYRGRLVDAATTAPTRRRPTASKHGVFSACPTLPGEDPREFQELHSALIEEWKPSGPTEKDRVFSIADAMWRKRRSQNFVEQMALMHSLDPEHPAFNERQGLVSFADFIVCEPETAFDKHARHYLRADKINHLKQKFPLENYNTALEWALAVMEEIKSVLLPKAPLFGVVQPEVRLWAAISTFHAREFLDQNLNLLARLDARIARLTKELLEMKAVKQMLGWTSED